MVPSFDKTISNKAIKQEIKSKQNGAHGRKLMSLSPTLKLMGEIFSISITQVNRGAV